MAQDFDVQRRRMVEHQLRRRGIEDERVLEAMASVPRELFLSDRQRESAYADGALPIGHGQTISQPWIVGAIAQALALSGEETVLEIGTGSGYSTAVLARLASMVVTIENVEPLAQMAAATLGELGIRNVVARVGDGTEGAPDLAPFDGVAVHAATPRTPPRLLEQLVEGGRMVIPITRGHTDELTVITRTSAEADPATGRGYEQRVIAPTRFVPLVSGPEGASPQ
jgi:protein-L-isoaspartate(D-aspartate) O-methyltransferase